MKKLFIVLAVASLGFVACNNDAETKDATADSAKSAIENASDSAKNAIENASDSAKSAIDSSAKSAIDSVKKAN